MTPDAAAPPPGAAGGPAHREIGWGRAIASGLLIVAVAFAGCVWLPNLIVTRFTGASPDTMADTALAIAVAWVLLLAWALRRLQARGLI